MKSEPLGKKDKN